MDFQKFLDETLGKVELLQENYDVELPEYDIFSEICDEIINNRNEAGLTQKELAATSGLTQSNISKFENGISKPSIESLKKIADALGKRLIVRFVDVEDDYE